MTMINSYHHTWDFQICEFLSAEGRSKIDDLYYEDTMRIDASLSILFVVNYCLLLLPLWVVLVLCSVPFALSGFAVLRAHHLKASDSALLRIFRRPNGKCTSIPSPCACLSGVLLSTGAYYSRSMRRREGGPDNTVLFCFSLF